jgi:hypothetical protein
MNTVYCDKRLMRKQIYNILKKIEDWKNTDDLRDSDPKKMVQTGQINR